MRWRKGLAGHLLANYRHSRSRWRKLKLAARQFAERRELESGCETSARRGNESRRIRQRKVDARKFAALQQGQQTLGTVQEIGHRVRSKLKRLPRQTEAKRWFRR